MVKKYINILIFLLPVVIACEMIRSKYLVFGYDAFNYHLYVADAWFRDRLGQDFFPAGSVSYQSPWIDLLWYYFGWVKHSSVLAVFAVTFVQALSFPVFFYISKSFLPEKTLAQHPFLPLVFTIFAVFSPLETQELGTTFGDFLSGVPFLFGLFLILLSLERKDLRFFSVFYIGGALLCGISVGLKLSNVTYVFALAVCLLFCQRQGFKLAFLKVFIFCLASFTAYLFLEGGRLYENWVQFGSPFVPFYTNLFPSPYFQPTGGMQTGFQPKNFWVFLVSPLLAAFYPSHSSFGNESGITLVSWGVFYIMFWLIALVLLGSFLFEKAGLYSGKLRGQIIGGWRALTSAQKIIILLPPLAYIFWAKMFAITRYLTATDLILPLSIFLLGTVLFGINMRVKIAVAGMSVLYGVMFFVNYPNHWQFSKWTKPLFYAEVFPVKEPEKTVFTLFRANCGYDYAPSLSWLSLFYPAQIHFQEIPETTDDICLNGDAAWMRMNLKPEFYAKIRSNIQKATYNYALFGYAGGMQRIYTLYRSSKFRKKGPALFDKGVVKTFEDQNIIIDFNQCRSLKTKVGGKIGSYKLCPLHLKEHS